jgi:hypothetical protein
MPGGGLFGRTTFSVGTESCGKNQAPSGRVVYVRPVGDVQLTVPSGS